MSKLVTTSKLNRLWQKGILSVKSTLEGLISTERSRIDDLENTLKDGLSNVVYLSQDEYDALPDSKLTDDIEYRITDANATEGKAKNLSYDNTNSGINAVNVQGAIDELNDGLSDYKEYIPLFGTTYGRGAITNALAVSSTADNEANKVGYVLTEQTINLPTDCSHGIREVYCYDNNNIFVKITGVDLSGKYCEWGNRYNGTTWTGWVHFDKLNYLNLTLPETSALEVCKYIKNNMAINLLHRSGYHFNILVNNKDWFSGHMYSDGNNTWWGIIQQRNSSAKNGSLYRYFGSANSDSIVEVGGNKQYICRGKLLSSQGEGTLEGFGNATINISNGVATIDFTVKVETAGTVTGAGIIVRIAYDDLVSSCKTGTLPKISPLGGGNITYYKPDGTINTNLTGYGGTVTPRDTEWLMSRMYTTAGDVGSWGEGVFTSTGIIVSGTIYGTVG